MRRRQTSKGQSLTLILLVLLAVVVIFGLIFVGSFRARARPTVQEAVWIVNDQQVSTARVGEKVEARVVIKTTEEYAGSVVVKIRKDVTLWFDSDYQLLTVPVSLKGGEQKEIELVFTPDQASGGRLRGYFIEIEFQATGTTWVMESSYPPRIKVID